MKTKKSILNLLSAFLIGAFLSAAILIVLSKIIGYDHTSLKDYLSGGWALSAVADDNDEPDRPHSFDFKENTVSITTENGSRYECKYSIIKQNDLGESVLIIHDYPGIGDLEYYVDLQTVMRLKSNQFDGEYRFAG